MRNSRRGFTLAANFWNPDGDEANRLSKLTFFKAVRPGRRAPGPPPNGWPLEQLRQLKSSKEHGPAMVTFNARAETVETKAVFRDVFKRSCCLIPMLGYYEWQNTPGGKRGDPSTSAASVARE